MTFCSRPCLPILQEKFKPVPQDASQVTFSQTLGPEEERLDWNRSARDIFNQIRGMYPWPVVYCSMVNVSRIYEADLVRRSRTGWSLSLKKPRRAFGRCDWSGAISLQTVRSLQGSLVWLLLISLNGGRGRNLEVGVIHWPLIGKTARGRGTEVLEEVFQEGAYSNIALNARLSKSHLTDKDKALVTEIDYGTVARKITLEWILPTGSGARKPGEDS